MAAMTMTELPRSAPARVCDEANSKMAFCGGNSKVMAEAKKPMWACGYRRLQRVRCWCEQSKIAFNFSNGLNMAQAIRIARCIAWNATYLVDWLTSKPYDDIFMRSPFCTNSRTHTGSNGAESVAKRRMKFGTRVRQRERKLFSELMMCTATWPANAGDANGATNNIHYLCSCGAWNLAHFIVLYSVVPV